MVSILYADSESGTSWQRANIVVPAGSILVAANIDNLYCSYPEYAKIHIYPKLDYDHPGIGAILAMGYAWFENWLSWTGRIVIKKACLISACVKHDTAAVHRLLVILE